LTVNSGSQNLGGFEWWLVKVFFWVRVGGVPDQEGNFGQLNYKKGEIVIPGSVDFSLHAPGFNNIPRE